MKKYCYYLALMSLTLYYSCKENNDLVEKRMEYLTIKGQTMGTTYTIKYENVINQDLKDEIDSLLILFNESVSTYDPESTISKFNASIGQFCYSSQDDQFLLESLSKALQISEETDGAFDPTIMPLVNYWGFGYKERTKIENPQEGVLDSLLNLVGYKKLGIMIYNDTVCLSRDNPEMSLDLSASAKGHGVDVVASMLSSYGIENFMVEIGGEVVTSGVNHNNEYWTIGINRPVKGANPEDIQLPVKLIDKAMATSGNYRNYYETGEITYAHIIDPKTGNSRPTDILSASIIADDCLTADAYATACMVLGLEKAKSLVANKSKIDACFIYVNADNEFKYFYTKGFSNYIDTLALN
jgi:thiamine biosynthesis lipoprotein